MKDIIPAVLIHTFGRNSRQPRQGMLRRLLFGFCLASAIDVIFSQSLATLRLSDDFPISWLVLTLILVTQITAGFIMLLVRASGYGLHDDQINDILGIMPVSELRRWVVGIIPGICVIIMVLVAATGPLMVVAGIVKLPWYWSLAGLSVGLISGVGIGTYQPHSSLGLNFLLMVALITSELLLFDRMVVRFTVYNDSFVYGFATFLILITIPLYWLARSASTWSQSRQRNGQHLLAWFTLPVNLHNWMALKVIRHPKVLRSSVLLFGVTAAITYAWSTAGIQKTTDISGIILILSFMAALASTDIRSLTRTQSAPEIIMVRGSQYFVLQQIFVGLGLSLVITVPLWGTILVHMGTIIIVLSMLAQLALGTIAALLSSTIFVPSLQDVSAEFFSTVVSTGLILGLEKLSGMTKLAAGLRAQSLLWLCLAFVMTGLVLLIEQRRNNYYWKGNSYVS